MTNACDWNKQQLMIPSLELLNGAAEWAADFRGAINAASIVLYELSADHDEEEECADPRMEALSSILAYLRRLGKEMDAMLAEAEKKQVAVPKVV